MTGNRKTLSSKVGLDQSLNCPLWISSLSSSVCNPYFAQVGYLSKRKTEGIRHQFRLLAHELFPPMDTSSGPQIGG